MNPLLLAAAGGLAREVLETVRAGDTHDVIGFLDDDPARWGEQLSGLPVLGGLDAADRYPEAQVVLCAGRGAARQRMAARLALPDERYATVVHPSVTVPASCSIGIGSIVLAGTVLTADVRIGGHVVVMPHVTFTHDDSIDGFATVCAGVTLGGSVHVGPVAYLGMSASVRENVEIGAAAVVGMGAVVLTDVPARETWVGVPARPLDRSDLHDLHHTLISSVTKAATS